MRAVQDARVVATATATPAFAAARSISATRILRLYHIRSGCSRAGASAATSPPPPPFLHTYRLIAPVPPHDARCVPPTPPTPHSPRSLNIRVLDHNEDKVFVGRHLKTMHSRVRIR